MKPTVLVLTPDFPPAFGGIQLLMRRLVEHCTRLAPRVVTFDQPEAAAFDRPAGVPVSRVPLPARLSRRRAVALLNAAALLEAARARPDVILSGHIALSPAAATAKRVLGVPYVQYLYGREVVTRPALSRFAIRRADALVAVSSYTRSLALANGAASERVHVIPPGVDLRKRGRVLRDSRPTVVSVARLEQRYKGHDVLIRALPLVRGRIPSVRLQVVGDGVLRPAYEGLVASLGLDGSVEFLGTVDDATREELLARAHVFAMPSRLPLDGGGEGFGIVYLEAGVHGLPVVAGRAAGALDAVVDGETGLLVDPSDHVALASAIVELLSDPAKASALGERGRARAASFSWPAVARRVEDVLLTVARR